jgi:VWFA-related protein
LTVVVPAALVVLSVAAGAQVPAVQDQRSAFRSAASLVALNVTVTDGNRLVTGLTAGDFEVYEDGVQQEVRFFESGSVPMDVILLLDTSASMRDQMPVVHEAARGFMSILRPGDRGAVVAFSDNVEVVQDLTSDVDLIEAAINSTKGTGATALHNALYVALTQFGRRAQRSGDVRRQAIAVLSDGEDTSSLVSFDDVVGLARRMGVNVYTIGLKPEPVLNRRMPPRASVSDADYSLKSLARETGARAFFPASVHDLNGVYHDIAEELKAQYSIAYAPANTEPDGRFRRIAVRVTADPDYRPRARAGYTASGPGATGSFARLR